MDPLRSPCAATPSQGDLQLSPLPSSPCAYAIEDPVKPRTTCCNNAWFESTGGSTEPSPLRLPFKSLHVAARTSQPGEADTGHLIVRVSSGREVSGTNSQASEASLQEKRRPPLGLLPPAEDSPRIRAHHSHKLDEQQGGGAKQQQHQQQPGLPARASAGSEAGSYIEWSLSSTSVGQQPSCSVDGSANAHHSSYLSYSLAAAPASAAAGAGEGSYVGEGGSPSTACLTEDASSSDLPSHGHIIAPAANVRYLWSPSTDAGVGASEAPSSTSSSLGRSCVSGAHVGSTLPGAHLSQLRPGPGGAGEASPGCTWLLDTRSRRWEQHHPIFGLQQQVELSTAAGPAVVPLPPPTAGAAAHEDGASTGQSSPHVSSGTASSQRPPSTSRGSSPRSPPLPTLHQSMWIPLLPSSSSHRRYHSAAPPQAASSQWAGMLDGPVLERAWSVSGSHFDLRLGTPASIQGCSALSPSSAPGFSAEEDVMRGEMFSLGRDTVDTPAESRTSVEPAHQIGLPAGAYEAALQRCKQLDIKRARRHVLSSPGRKLPKQLSLVQRLAVGCLNPAAGRLRWRLGKQRVRLLSWGAVPYNADDPLHFSLMQMVASGFSGRSRVADGWREAGFSSANPSTTDLVGCGILGLLYLLLLLEKRPHIAAELHRAAATGGPAAAAEGQPQQQQKQAVVSPALASVHVTLWTLQALRTGLMCRPARRLKCTTAAAECFYLGAMECLMTYWREAGEQPQLWQDVLHRAEKRAMSNVWPMIQRVKSVS